MSAARAPLSLKTRLIAVIGLVFVLGMGSVYLAARHYGELTANRSFDRLLEGSALSIIETLVASPGDIRVDIPYAALEMLSAAPEDRVFYRVIAPSGATVTGYGDLPPTPPDQLALLQLHGEIATSFDADYRGERMRFAVTGREIAQNGHKGWVWVQVGQSRIAREAVARESTLRALLPILIMTAVSILLIWFGISSALKPLRDIGRELSERQPADLHPLDTAVPREIAPLTTALNEFMTRLDGNIATLKDFIADAAHQLRTPLAAMMAQAYASPRDTPEDLRRSLAAVERNGVKLTHLLNQLLSDATMAHRADLREFKVIDLRQILREVLLDTARNFEDADVRLTSTLASAPLPGDSFMLTEALKNILANAILHGAGANGEDQVELDLTSNGESYVLLICDRGPGIEPQDRERVFQRFVRGESQAAGSGVGLSIARQAIETHHGTISLGAREGGGLTVTITLPQSML